MSGICHHAKPKAKPDPDRSITTALYTLWISFTFTLLIERTSPPLSTQSAALLSALFIFYNILLHIFVRHSLCYECPLLKGISEAEDRRDSPSTCAALAARACACSMLAGFSRCCCWTERGTAGISGSFSRHSGPSSSISIFVILARVKERETPHTFTFIGLMLQSSTVFWPLCC